MKCMMMMCDDEMNDNGNDVYDNGTYGNVVYDNDIYVL